VTAEPIVFPAPPDAVTAGLIEDTAEQIQIEHPHRSLLECRQLAAQLVDAVQCWEAEYAG